jgi:hypothetical protein
VPPQEPPLDPAEPDLPPDKAAALRRAEEIVGRREHPEFNPERLKRPQSVWIGCVMAWIGCARLLYEAINLFQVDKSSTGFDKDWTAEEIETAVAWAHLSGQVDVLWLLLILTFSLLAFFGRQWAGTALVVMAVMWGIFSLISLVTAFAPIIITAAFWSAAVVTFIRFREPSKDWYRALREWKALNAEA